MQQDDTELDMRTGNGWTCGAAKYPIITLHTAGPPQLVFKKMQALHALKDEIANAKEI